MARMPRLNERVTYFGEPATVVQVVPPQEGRSTMYVIRLDYGDEENVYHDEILPMSGGEFTTMAGGDDED